jgi:hypothetical protein
VGGGATSLQGADSMIVKPTVFVLGAGAMVDYGFPTGWELVKDVIHKFTPRALWRELLRKHGHCSDEQVGEFLSALDGSAQNSVDAFLEERGEFLEIGIAAMSIVLIDKEISEKLYQERDPSKNWLRNLMTHLRSPSFEKFGENAVSFVTFNYDRSLEFFLCKALSETFGKSEKESGEQLSRIPIIHLHGRLGYLPWESKSDARPYEPIIDDEALKACVKDVKVVNRNITINEGEFKRAKELLSQAERIYFLGVGFYNDNLARLGVMDFVNDRASATCVGLNQKEWGELTFRFGGKLKIAYGMNCIDLLRNEVAWD